MSILKRINVIKTLEDLTENAKSIDIEKLKKEIEAEGNRIASRNTQFLIDADVFIALVKKSWMKTAELILHFFRIWNLFWWQRKTL